MPTSRCPAGESIGIPFFDLQEGQQTTGPSKYHLSFIKKIGAKIKNIIALKTTVPVPEYMAPISMPRKPWVSAMNPEKKHVKIVHPSPVLAGS